MSAGRNIPDTFD